MQHTQSLPCPKLAPQRIGPYRILEVVSPVAYRLDLPASRRIHNVINIDHLTAAPSTPDPFGRSPPSHVPAPAEHSPILLVLAERRGNAGPQYLCRRVGTEDTWLPAATVQLQGKAALDAFLDQHQRAPRD